MKMRVSDETFLFVERIALVHVFGWRKIGRDSWESEGVKSPPSWRMSREAWSREPIW